MTLGASTPVPTRAGDTIDIYHGRAVADPFRWLEDLDSDETRAWIGAQNDHTSAFLTAAASRELIRERLAEIWNYERRSTPSREGDSIAYFVNSGLQNQAVLYVADALDAPSRILLDPNTLSDDGTVALGGAAFSHDGHYLAYALTVSGSDWLEWRVRDVATGIDASDLVRWGKFSSAAWLADGSGFFYCRYDEPAADAFKAANYYHKVYFHALGSAQSDDRLVYERPDHKDWNFAPTVSEDGRWLIVNAKRGTEPRNRIFVQDLAAGGPFVALLDAGDASYEFVGNDGERLYFLTTRDAERGRVIAVDATGGDIDEVIPHGTDVIESVVLAGDTFVVHALHDAHSVLALYDMRGAARGTIALPGVGSVSALNARRSNSDVFFSFTSYTQPASVYCYDTARAQRSLIFAPRVAFDPADFVTEEHVVISPDGTRVPMLVTAKRGLSPDVPAPSILYGYGGFGISLLPAFSPAVLVWLEMGGRYAVANIRGGGEYGEAWHDAGTGKHKQNVFDDFIAAAEHLIARGLTSPRQLAIAGGSNGGLLVGAVMTQRPELFGAALPAVGVLDMLRYQHFTIGWAWTTEYGSSEDAEAFETIFAYSPLHAIRDGVAYPATLVTTGDHDDRVFPAHSFKFAARLQAAQGGPAPILIRIEEKAGHGAGKPTAKVIAEATDRYAFLTRVFDMNVPSLASP